MHIPPRKAPIPEVGTDILVWLACTAAVYLKPSAWLQQKAQRHLGWLPAICHRRALAGFTLAELLICIAILGVIAIFTIPKIMTAQQNAKSNAVTKETVAMVSDAFQKYKMTNNLTLLTTLGALTPYMNYVSAETSGVTSFDGNPGSSVSAPCGWPFGCIHLQNGTTFVYPLMNHFCTSLTANTAMYFFVDPDGVYSGSGTNADGPGKSVMFWLYPNGKIRDSANTDPNTEWSGCGVTVSITVTNTPSWFSWN